MSIGTSIFIRRTDLSKNSEIMEQKFIFSGQNYDLRTKYLLFLSIGIFVFLRFLSVGEIDLWYDEVFTVQTIRQNWLSMYSSVIQDGVHPPLFYVLLKIWSLIDSSVWWLQGFPFLISILTILPLYLFCRELKLNFMETAVVFLTIAVNEYFLEYALDLRMYGLVQFFSLFSLWTFTKLLNSGRARGNIFWVLAFCNFLLVYTHYFGWLIVGFEGLYLIVWQRSSFYKFAVGVIGVLLLFGAWIWLVMQNAVNHGATGNLHWLTRPTFSDLLWFYSTLNGNLNISHTTFVNLLIFMTPVCFLFWNTVQKKKQDFNWRLITLFAFAPVILTFIASHILSKSVWQSRYLIITAVPYVILFVKSAFSLHNKFFRFAALAVILGWSLTAGFYNFSLVPKQIEWSAVVKKIQNEDTSAKIVYVFDNWIALPLRFYSNEANFSMQVEKPDSAGDIPEKNFWLVLRFPIAEESYNLPEALQQRKCRIVERNDYFDGGQRVSVFNVGNCQ